MECPIDFKSFCEYVLVTLCDPNQKSNTKSINLSSSLIAFKKLSSPIVLENILQNGSKKVFKMGDRKKGFLFLQIIKVYICHLSFVKKSNLNVCSRQVPVSEVTPRFIKFSSLKFSHKNHILSPLEKNLSLVWRTKLSYNFSFQFSCLIRVCCKIEKVRLWDSMLMLYSLCLALFLKIPL